jgi:hypothetical protein
MKSILTYIYIIGALIYMVVDYIQAYGDDSLLFWVFIRPFLSSIKGLLWPIMILF